MLRPKLLGWRRGRGRVQPCRFYETLEPRRLLSTIAWTNRGNNDGFDTVFGTNAALARSVVDAALMSWQNVIASFNLPTQYHDTYSVSISMNTTTSGLGASASISGVTNTAPRKPVSGSISILRGNQTNGADWFLDPTPYDSSEFTSSILNAFDGTAPSSSPAFNKADLFTVVAHEMTHLLGLSSDSRLTEIPSLSSNTGVHDTAQGGGTGFFWAFHGPSIKHLLTSFDSGGGDLGTPVHSAAQSSSPGNPMVSVNFGGDTYIGAFDVVNPNFYYSQRYLVPDTIALVLKDAYGYTENVLPQSSGTFYATLESNGQLLVRGGSGGSNDVISISQSGGNIVASVDVGNDVPGTGTLPGAGNLPAFVSTFPASSVTSINIQAGDGNDSIDIASLPANMPVSVDGGTGNNTITIHAPVLPAMTINGGSGGTNILKLTDVAATDNLTVNSGQVLFGAVPITYSNAAVQLDGSGTITLNSLSIGAGAKLAVTLGASAKTLQINAALAIDPAGTLDLTNNSLVVVAGNLAGINALVASGYAGGAWTGNGIMTSAYHPTVQFTGDIAPWTNLGVGLVGGNVLVKYTYQGDVDLNGVVNAADFAQIKYGSLNQVNGTIGGQPLAYSDGDVDYNGAINAADFAMTKSASLNQGASLAAVAQLALAAAAPAATAVPTAPSAGTAGIAQPVFSAIAADYVGVLDQVLVDDSKNDVVG